MLQHAFQACASGALLMSSGALALLASRGGEVTLGESVRIEDCLRHTSGLATARGYFTDAFNFLPKGRHSR